VRPTIVVGLGGGGGWHALAWATNEALSSGARLVLCHACRPDSVLASRGPAAPTGLLELVDPALARAVTSARTRLGGDRVTLRVLPGRPEHLLVEGAADADLVVVGPPTASTPGPLGSTAHYVAAHAPCPVVVVRPVSGGREAPFAGHVVIGVKDSAAGRAALEFGFGYADAHARPVAAVHVSPDRHEDVWFDQQSPPTRAGARTADLGVLADEVEPWMRKYPAVAVKQAVHAGRPLPGLLRAATAAHLLVVGDHRHRPAARALLGTVADGALDRAGCPVAVVHDWDTQGGQTC
jgi:nucleotide-binding universal stress UspA family protein